MPDSTSEIAPVLATDFKQGMCDLPKRATLGGFHQGGEHVAVVHGHLAQVVERGWGAGRMALLKSGQACNAAPFLILARARQLDALRNLVPCLLYTSDAADE